MSTYCIEFKDDEQDLFVNDLIIEAMPSKSDIEWLTLSGCHCSLSLKVSVFVIEMPVP